MDKFKVLIHDGKPTTTYGEASTKKQADIYFEECQQSCPDHLITLEYTKEEILETYDGRRVVKSYQCKGDFCLNKEHAVPCENVKVACIITTSFAHGEKPRAPSYCSWSPCPVPSKWKEKK